MFTKIAILLLAAFVLSDGITRAETADPKPLAGFEPKPGCNCGDGCQCEPGQCPGNCALEYVAAAAGGRWKQQCDGKKCYWVWVPDATPDPAPAAPAVESTAVQIATFDQPETMACSARRRGILGRIVDAIRDREPIFPNRPKLRGGWFRGGCCN